MKTKTRLKWQAEAHQEAGLLCTVVQLVCHTKREDSPVFHPPNCVPWSCLEVVTFSHLYKGTI